MLLRTGIVLTVTAVVALAASDEPASSDARIKQLREERLAVLKQIHETFVTLQQSGVPGFGVEQANQAMTELLRARLDLAVTKQERIKIHEELVANAKKSLDLVTALTNTGAPGGSHLDLLRSKAYYLEAQVNSEQARAAS